MNQKEIMEYAIKGLAFEITTLEESIRKGKSYLYDRSQGKKDKSPKTDDEIRELIKKKNAEIDELEAQKTVLIWELAITKDA